MGLYAKYIFPHMLEYVMSSSILVDCRKDTLSEVKGEILEIGFGTGMNLPYYPENVRRITGVDININIHSKAEKRLKSSHIQVDYYPINIEYLPFPDNTFDTVVSTFTLCSIKDIHRALSEIARVLRLNGRFFFAKERVETNEVRLPNNRILGSVLANAACIPVEQIEYPGKHPTKEFWNDPRAFYGRMLPYSDEPGHQPENIKGMSGGPLISIERTPNREFRYRLFGIQRSWDENTWSIRVEPIENIIPRDEYLM